MAMADTPTTMPMQKAIMELRLYFLKRKLYSFKGKGAPLVYATEHKG